MSVTENCILPINYDWKVIQTFHLVEILTLSICIIWYSFIGDIDLFFQDIQNLQDDASVQQPKWYHLSVTLTYRSQTDILNLSFSKISSIGQDISNWLVGVLIWFPTSILMRTLLMDCNLISRSTTTILDFHW